MTDWHEWKNKKSCEDSIKRNVVEAVKVERRQDSNDGRTGQDEDGWNINDGKNGKEDIHVVSRKALSVKRKM